MKTKHNDTKILEQAALGTLNTMSKAELVALSRYLGIKVGKTKNDLVLNLLMAADGGLLHTKLRVEFAARPANPTDFRVPLFGKKFSTGKSPKITRHITHNKVTPPPISS